MRSHERRCRELKAQHKARVSQMQRARSNGNLVYSSDLLGAAALFAVARPFEPVDAAAVDACLQAPGKDSRLTRLQQRLNERLPPGPLRLPPGPRRAVPSSPPKGAIAPLSTGADKAGPRTGRDGKKARRRPRRSRRKPQKRALAPEWQRWRGDFGDNDTKQAIAASLRVRSFDMGDG